MSNGWWLWKSQTEFLMAFLTSGISLVWNLDLLKVRILLVSKRIKLVLRPIKPHFKNISFQWSTNLGVSCFLQLMLTRDRRAKNDLRDWSVVYSLAQELRCANLQPSSWCHEPDSWPINQQTLKLLGHSQKYFLISKLWSGCKGSFAWIPQPFFHG